MNNRQRRRAGRRNVSDQTQNKPVFRCLPKRMLRWYVIYDRVTSAANVAGLPADNQIVGIADLLANNLAQTLDIEFPVNEDTPEEWAGLQEFWVFAATSDDYPAIWNKALETLDLDVLLLWNDQVTAKSREALRAPDELQPGSPADEDLPPNS